MKNYRPVIVLNVVNKIFEQLLSRQVVTKVDSHLSQNMLTYRKGQSCQTALIKFIEDWRLANDMGKFVGVTSTDTSKAFGSLLPSLMIKKLQACNFSDESLLLLRSYFQDQQGRVKFARVNSSWHDIREGCPQGSCLEPLLSNMFQNDLSYSINNCDFSTYADDLQICASHQLIETLLLC